MFLIAKENIASLALRCYGDGRHLEKLRIGKFLPRRFWLKTVNVAFGFILTGQIWYRWKEDAFIFLILAFCEIFRKIHYARLKTINSHSYIIKIPRETTPNKIKEKYHHLSIVWPSTNFVTSFHDFPSDRLQIINEKYRKT